LTRRVVAVLLALVAACDQAADNGGQAAQDSAPPAPYDESAEHQVAFGPEGWGVLQIGMSRAEVVAAAGDVEDGKTARTSEPAQCELFAPAGAPDGMLVMIENDKLTRITLRAPSALKTARGFTIGDPAAAIKKAYGAAATVTPHKYDAAPAEYITVWTQPDSRGIVYEIGTDGKVKQIHAGGPSIQYVEGCG
jgi:hypothetical protein